jgi:plasmid maintenance system antidote protein VapI
MVKPLVHPGEILLAEFLQPLEVSQYGVGDLCATVPVPPVVISRAT